MTIACRCLGGCALDDEVTQLVLCQESRSVPRKKEHMREFY